MKSRWLQAGSVRFALLGAVAAAPLILFAVFRPRSGIDAPALVWAELPLAEPRLEYAPRTPVFDGARRSITVSAARGETTGFLVRVLAREPLGEVHVQASALERRRAGPAAGGGPPGGGPRLGPAVPLTLQVRRLERTAVGDGALGAAEPGSLASGAQAEWLVEVTVPPATPPGMYAGMLRVRGGGDTLERFGVALTVWRSALGECPARFDGADRAAAWRAFAGGTATPVPAGGCAFAAAVGTLGAFARREAEDDLRYLELLRAKRDGLVEQVVRRAVAAPPAGAVGWDGLRRELVGLLNASGL